MTLMRSITSSQFTGALADSLKPRLQGTCALLCHHCILRFSYLCGYLFVDAEVTCATACAGLWVLMNNALTC